MIVKEERPPQEVVMVSAPTPGYSAPGPETKFDTSYNAPPPRQQPPPTSYNAPPPRQQPPPSYEISETKQQPPVSYEAPEIEEQPPPSTYSPSFAPEQPPVVYQRPTTTSTSTTTLRTTTRRVTERPPVTYAPTFVEEELPPYRQDESLPAYQDNLPGYNNNIDNNNINNDPVFVTPRTPSIRLQPKLRLVGKKSKESISMVNPRSGQQKFAFSTLLPSMNSIATTTPKPARTSTISSFSDIFSNLQRNEENPRTSYKNNASPPSFIPEEEEESYGQPLGKPLGKPITTSNDGSRFPLYDDLAPPVDYSYDSYDDEETISGIDPRFNENFIDAVSDNPSFDISEKLQRAKDNDDVNDFDQTTRIKGILKKSSKPFSRFRDSGSASPPPGAQFSEGYSGPVADTEAPSVFTDILDPVTTKYQSPPRRPDSSYTISVDPEQATNGHGGKISIDINVNIQGEGDQYGDTGVSNSHGPVQTTHQTHQTPSEADLPPSSNYARPTDSGYVGPITTSSYKQSAPADEGYSAPVTKDYAFSDLVDSSKTKVGPTDTYASPTVKPRKKKPSYPRTYGSKVSDEKPNDFVAPDYVTVNDDRPNDFVAPDYNTEIYKDDITAPDIIGEYETPSAPVVDDYYPHDDYAAPVVEDYYQHHEEYFPEENYDEDSYYGHEAPGYDNFEEDYFSEKPHKYKHKKHKKHKKVKPFVDFGRGHYKPKQHYKPHYEEDFYEQEPHAHHEEYHDVSHYEPLEKPFYEPAPLYEPPTVYEEPYHEPLEKPIYQEEQYYHPEPYYEPPSYDDESKYEHGSLYIEPVSKGYYEKTTELIPELKDVIKPLDWNVHDFSSWRRLLDPKRFGGTMSDYRPKTYGKHLEYEPEITNEISYDAPNVFDEPLYYEDYTEKPSPYVEYDDGYDYNSPYHNPVLEYDTYDPYDPYYKPQKKTLKIPKPFNIPFDSWLDSSGVGAFGLPSSTYRTYASPPVKYNSYSHIGQRHHSNQYSDHYNLPYYATSLDEWVPSEKPLQYKPSYLQHHQKTQVELPFLTQQLSLQPSAHSAKAREIKPKLYIPPSIKAGSPVERNFDFRKLEEKHTEPSDPGSIWTGLSSFVSSLDPRNHYRSHPTGMVSMGSDQLGVISNSDDMLILGSQNHAVMVKPPSEFNFTGTTVHSITYRYSGVGNSSEVSNDTTSVDGVRPSAAPMSSHSGHDLQVSLSAQENRENSNNVINHGEKMHSDETVKNRTNLERYLLDSSYFGSTLINMAKMLETYLR